MTLRRALATVCVLALAACSEKPAVQPPVTAPPVPVLRVSAPPALSGIAKMWGEEFKARSGVPVEIVPGSPSDSVMKDLLEEGPVTALGFQPLRPDQKAQVLQKHGQDIIEITAGMQACAVYVHSGSPVQSLSLEQLKGIFGQDGGITDWKQTGVEGLSGAIALLGLPKESPGFTSFFDIASSPRAGGVPVVPAAGIGVCDDNAALVAAVAADPLAIGIGHLTEEAPGGVRKLPLSSSPQSPAVPPGFNEVRMGRYPLSRRFQVYAVGPMEGAVKDFVAYILSPEGQKLLPKAGAVPLR